MGDMELYYKTMDKLERVWLESEEMLLRRRASDRGIRSSQIAALVLLLIELGIVKET